MASGNNDDPDESMADVSIVNLNDSVSDMASVSGQSMAGLSDASKGKIKRVTADGASDGDTSMMSGSDVQVVRAGGGNETMDMNTSMAGLSDMSMGEIQRVNNDSMADYSMASLNDDSMANVNDSAYKVQMVKNNSDITEDSNENILDDLKEELGLPNVANPQGTDNSFIKQQALADAYRASEVYNEDDEDDYSDDEDDSKPKRKGSFKKHRRSNVGMAPPTHPV